MTNEWRMTNEEAREVLSKINIAVGFGATPILSESQILEATSMAIKALERVHTMSKEEMEAYLKDEDLVVVKRKYLKKALKVLDQISHLKDRPCEACEFYTEEGCSKWECVFEGSDSE